MSEYIIMPTGDYQAACDIIRAASGETDLIKSGDLSTEIAKLINKTGKAEFKVGDLPSADYVNWRSITYGNGKFVAVGDSSKVIYSIDGINWGSTDLSIGDWKSVTYGNGKFVAVAYNNSAYSTDGITWTISKVTSFLFRPNSITYGNGKFVAVGSKYSSSASMDLAYYSEDGINWNSSSSLNSSHMYYLAVTYGNGKFVTLAHQKSKASYSIDGINWTEVTLPKLGYWESATYGNGKFVAAGYRLVGNYYENVVVYSTDGITWNSVGMLSDYNIFPRSITYDGNKFIVLSDITIINNTTSVIAYSADGISWIKATIPSKGWNSITYGDDKLIALGDSASYAICDYSKVGIA